LEEIMTARSIRRAVERKANKLARKSAQQGITLATENQPAIEEAEARPKHKRKRQSPP
jgi:hypothetical protein